MKRIVIGAVALLAATGSASADKGPLAPLGALGDRMERIMDAVLAGGDGTAAAGDWKVELRDGFRKDLAAAGTKSRLAGYEFEIILGSEKDHDQIDMIVHATSRSSAILGIKTSTDHWRAGARPIDKLTGAQKPLADAARALLAAAKAKDSCLKLPMADAALLAEVAPGPIGVEVKKMGTPDAKVCGAFERAKSPIYVNADDAVLLILDKDGAVLGGVRTHLELDDKGGVKLELRRYKSLAKAKSK